MTLTKPLDPQVIHAITKTLDRNPLENKLSEKEKKNPEDLFIKKGKGKKKK